MLDNDYLLKNVFNNKLFKDFRSDMTQDDKATIRNLLKFDLTQMAEYCNKFSEDRKNMTKEENLKIKEDNPPLFTTRKWECLRNGLCLSNLLSTVRRIQKSLLLHQLFIAGKKCAMIMQKNGWPFGWCPFFFASEQQRPEVALLLSNTHRLVVSTLINLNQLLSLLLLFDYNYLPCMEKRF